MYVYVHCSNNLVVATCVKFVLNILYFENRKAITIPKSMLWG